MSSGNTRAKTDDAALTDADEDRDLDAETDAETEAEVVAEADAEVDAFALVVGETVPVTAVDMERDCEATVELVADTVMLALPLWLDAAERELLLLDEADNDVVGEATPEDEMVA